MVDGEYIDEQKNLTLKWCGSRNQHVIDVKQSMAQNKMVLFSNIDLIRASYEVVAIINSLQRPCIL